jgi:hypothetical protein
MQLDRTASSLTFVQRLIVGVIVFAVLGVITTVLMD